MTGSAEVRPLEAERDKDVLAMGRRINEAISRGDIRVCDECSSLSAYHADVAEAGVAWGAHVLTMLDYCSFSWTCAHCGAEHAVDGDPEIDILGGVLDEDPDPMDDPLNE